MCEPISMILMAAGGLASALASKPKKPPPPIEPASTPAPARESGAVVRLGDGNKLTPDNETAPAEVAFVEKRKQAQALGGLGRSGGLGL